MTSTSIPKFNSPLAASRPNKPPPITAAFLKFLEYSIIFSQSSIFRKAVTPFLSAPGIGRIKGTDPVAKIN